MLFADRRKASVMKFLRYVENELVGKIEPAGDVVLINIQIIKTAYELLEYNEWGLAFEFVADNLIEQNITLDEKGLNLAEEVINRCKLNKSWLAYLTKKPLNT